MAGRDDVLADPRARLFVHEAGHAVAHLISGSPTVRVELTANGAGEVTSGYLSADADATEVFSCMVGLAAGVAAEEVIFGSALAGAGQMDAEGLRYGARHLHGILSSETKRKHAIEKARREARRLMKKHRAEVLRMAEILQQADVAAKTIRSAARHG
jgi:ATP-dependent Zn protease